jgi:hypothetical protein
VTKLPLPWLKTDCDQLALDHDGFRPSPLLYSGGSSMYSSPMDTA